MTYHEMIEKVKRALLSMQRMAWEQGVAAQAFFEIGDAEMGVLLAKEAAHRSLEDGRVAIISDFTASLDSGVSGIPLLWAAEYTGDMHLKETADKLADFFLHTALRGSEGVLYQAYIPENPESNKWSKYIMVDGIYHIAPFLSACGYHEEALNQILGMKKILFDTEKKLYHQIWDDAANDYGRKDFWGGGNGWMAATLSRMLKLMPSSMESQKQELEYHLKELIDSMLVYLRDDGLFHDVLDDPDTFAEATAGLMLAYAIFRGVEGGWLGKEYLTPALEIRAAAHARVDEYGILQDVCDAPTFSRRGTSPEAQAFLLLVEAAYIDLHKACII